MNKRMEWLQSFKKELDKCVSDYGFRRDGKHICIKTCDGLRFEVEVLVNVPLITHVTIKYHVLIPSEESGIDNELLAEASVGRLAGHGNGTYQLPYWFMFQVRKAGGDILKDVETTISWFSINFGTRKACLNYLEQSDMKHDCINYKHNYRYLTETMHLAGFNDEKIKEM